jgi:hypothetical protein
VTNLGKDAAYKHDLLPKKVEEGLIVTEAQYFPETKSYQRQERLNAFLKIIRMDTMVDPADWNLDLAIRFCFGELFWLFDTKFNMSGQHRNFLSYGYFINRILELHKRIELRDKLGIKEPIVVDVRHENDRLW